MRLHRLAVTAFGPFREHQVVDFDALSESGLFLLTGPTGAGKTSVLDAVTYALYGQVPGARATVSRVRSDHADPGTPTVVELELSIRGVRLRVQRIPDWDRPKKRGGGTTRERGKVLLERERAGAWEFVSSRHDEVGHELGALLGLSHDQFCQVVLLPQGGFASFLRADAETRKRLLEQLFGTERFSAVESWLNDLRAARGEAFDQQLERRSELIARLAEVVDEANGPAPDAPDDDVLGWADSALADLGRRRIAALEAVRVTTAAHGLATAQVADARSAAARQGRLRELRDRERRARAAARVRAARADELAAASRAAALGPLLEGTDEATETFAAASRVAAAARALVARHGVPADGPVEVLQTRERDLRAELTRLGDLSCDAARLTAIDDELAETARRLAAAGSEDAAHLEALAAAPAQRLALEARVRAAELAGEHLPEIQSRLTAASERAAAAAARDELGAQRARAEELRRRKVDAAQTARSVLLDVRTRRLDGMAAELAAALHTGQACPVCGSAEHPQPAATHDAISEADEAAARAVLDLADEELRRAECGLRRLADEHAAARVAAGGDVDAAALQAAVDDLAKRRADAARDAAGLPAASAALAAHDTATDARRAAQLLTQDAAREGRLKTEVLLAERATLEARVSAARGSDPDIPSRITRLGAAADALAGAAAATVDEDHARRSLATAERRLTRAAQAAGFADAGAAAVASRTKAQLTQLTDAISGHDQEVALVAAALAEPDLHDLALEEPAQVAEQLSSAELAAETASAALGAAQRDAGRLEAAHRKALTLHGDLVGAVSRLRPLRADFDAADTLARLATGTGADNRLRMRLSYYVLSARLEQVAAAASERLVRMSDGRFTLRHTDERAGGNQRSGLGLQICDSWYGTTRDPSTLSGGETFMASLSLALGLADVVVAEAGGMLMDTLFVDEGFGSLDDQTLDAVLDVLDGLREGGRAVGLVSHVGELRDRIPAQLAVRKAQLGSSLRLTA